ncbi:MAG: EamA family transporter [Gaiellaceae bacterium]
MDAVGFALLAGALLGLLTVMIRFGLRKAPDVTASAFLITFIGLGVTVVVAVATGLERADLQLADLWPFLAIGVLVPGTGRLLYVRAVRDAGPSRAAILVGMAPLLSVLIAVAIVREPFGPALGFGTVLVVLGGTALVQERVRPKDFKLIGVVLALVVASLVAIRDNVVRSLTTSLDVAPVVEISAILAAASAIAFGYLVIDSRGVGGALSRTQGVFRTFLPMGVVAGFASLAVLESLDRGPVTVVAPLIATQTLWVVVLSSALIGRSEAIGPRLVVAAMFVVAGGALVGLGQ